jgi:hypothetical protein
MTEHIMKRWDVDAVQKTLLVTISLKRTNTYFTYFFINLNIFPKTNFIKKLKRRNDSLINMHEQIYYFDLLY